MNFTNDSVPVGLIRSKSFHGPGSVHSAASRFASGSEDVVAATGFISEVNRPLIAMGNK